MTLAELEAAIGWLERNRLSDYTAMLEGDARYDWTTHQARRMETLPSVVLTANGEGVSRSSKADMGT